MKQAAYDWNCMEHCNLLKERLLWGVF